MSINVLRFVYVLGFFIAPFLAAVKTYSFFYDTNILLLSYTTYMKCLAAAILVFVDSLNMDQRYINAFGLTNLVNNRYVWFILAFTNLFIGFLFEFKLPDISSIIAAFFLGTLTYSFLKTRP